MIYKPRAYQSLITDAIIENKRCNIFAFLGSGKTIATLTAIERMLLSGDIDYKVLVIAPLRVAQSAWPDEIAQWEHVSHLKVSVITGTPKQRLAAIAVNADIYTTNYENLPDLVKQFEGKPWPYKMIVADEATKLKGFRTRQGSSRAKAIATVAHKQVERWVNLTGSPIANGYKDTWGVHHFVDQGAALGKSYTAFKNRWFDTGYLGYSMNLLPHSEAEIKEAMLPTSYSLRANDWFNLKEPIKTIVNVKLPAKAMAQYLAMEKTFFAEISKGIEVEALTAATKSSKLLQMGNGAVYLDDEKNWEETHSEKIAALTSVIEEANGMPVLVSYTFKHDLVRLQKAFPTGKVLDKKPQTIKDWNAGKILILFAHPASCGHGLSLQHGGNILVFFSVSWSLEEFEQIIERLGPVRQMQSGYDRPVYLYFILAENTMDYDVMKRLETKSTVQEAFLQALKRRQE